METNYAGDPLRLQIIKITDYWNAKSFINAIFVTPRISNLRHILCLMHICHIILGGWSYISLNNWIAP